MVSACARQFPDSGHESVNWAPLAARTIIFFFNDTATTEIYTARAQLTSNECVAEHCSRSRAHRFDLLALSTTRGACHHRVVDSSSVRVSAYQGRRFAQSAVPSRHARVQDVRRGDTALPFERIRCPYRGRGQEPP